MMDRHDHDHHTTLTQEHWQLTHKKKKKENFLYDLPTHRHKNLFEPVETDSIVWSRFQPLNHPHLFFTCAEMHRKLLVGPGPHRAGTAGREVQNAMHPRQSIALQLREGGRGGKSSAPGAPSAALNAEGMGDANLQPHQRICGPHWNVIFTDR